MNRFVYAAAFAGVALAGCESVPTVRESELDRAPMTSKIEAQDIRRTVEKMNAELTSLYNALVKRLHRMENE